MKTSSIELKNKSAILLGLIGDSIPSEVYSYLKPEEIEKLLKEIDSVSSSSKEEESKVLSLFHSYFKNKKDHQTKNHLKDQTEFAKQILSEIEKIVNESKKEEKIDSYLKKIKKGDLLRLIQGEDIKITALVMSYSDPNESSLVFEEFSDEYRERIVEEIQGLDFYSESDLDDLERFVKFKRNILEKENSSVVKNRGGRKVADILTKVSPNISKDLLSKIKEKNPQFAENIIEHYYDMNDLLLIGRNSLTSFLSSFHPIIVAVALKGLETSVKEKILYSMESWFKKSIESEMDSMGPVSLLEIEEAQKGISEKLRDFVDLGKIKIWKAK